MNNDGPYKPPRKPTMQDVALALGVATATISNAYNRPDQLSADLRERVLLKAAELGYTGPDPIARSLRQQRAGAVGVLFAERLPYVFTDPAVTGMLGGVADALDGASLGMLLVPGRDQDFTGMVQQALVDGFIVYSMQENHPLVATVLARRLPTVLLDQPASGEAYSINVDDHNGAFQAAKLLLSLGHRRFAVVFDCESNLASGTFRTFPELATLTSMVVRQRLQGYRTALETAGVPWSSVLLYECADNSEADGAAAMHALLSCPQRPTAVLCITDRLALGAVTAAQQAGLSIPKDISVVGFDDIPQAASSQPALTTVRQDHHEKGLRAGNALVAMLRGEMLNASELLPVQLIARETTGSAPNLD